MKAVPVLAVVVMVLAPIVTHAQNFGRSGTDFRIEVDKPQPGARGPGIGGFVYNDTGGRVIDVRLRVEVLDAGGNLVAESFGWVYGSVGARDRAWFWVPLKSRGQEYRVSVYSFDRMSGKAP
jgi:hypothetical protein